MLTRKTLQLGLGCPLDLHLALTAIVYSLQNRIPGRFWYTELVTVGTTETLGSIVSFDGGSVGLTVAFKDGFGVPVGAIVIFGAIVPFEGVLTG